MRQIFEEKLTLARRLGSPVALVITIQPESLSCVINPNPACLADCGVDGASDPFWICDTHGRAAISGLFPEEPQRPNRAHPLHRRIYAGNMGFLACCPSAADAASLVVQSIIPYEVCRPPPTSLVDLQVCFYSIAPSHACFFMCISRTCAHTMRQDEDLRAQAQGVQVLSMRYEVPATRPLSPPTA